MLQRIMKWKLRNQMKDTYREFLKKKISMGQGEGGLKRLCYKQELDQEMGMLSTKHELQRH